MAGRCACGEAAKLVGAGREGRREQACQAQEGQAEQYRWWGWQPKNESDAAERQPPRGREDRVGREGWRMSSMSQDR